MTSNISIPLQFERITSTSVIHPESTEVESSGYMGSSNNLTTLESGIVNLSPIQVSPTPHGGSKRSSRSRSECPSSPPSSSKKKRKRTTPEQLDVLENVFLSTHHPNLAMRNQLAVQLGMLPRSVQIWFQNRRAKERNKEYKSPRVTPRKASDAQLLTSICHLIHQEDGNIIDDVDDDSLLDSSGDDESKSRFFTKLTNIASELDLSDPANLNHLRYQLNARLSEQGISLLFTAALLNNERQLVDLLNSGAETNTFDPQGNSPLLAASSLGYSRIVELLLKFGASYALTNHHGCTALYAAAKNGHADIVKILIRAGADGNVQEKEFGESPLHIAALKGDKEVVKLLLDCSKNHAGMKDYGGYTPLHHAAVYGHWEIVGLLLEYGANVNEQDNGGRTSVHAAALHGHLRVLQRLLEGGAFVDAKDGKGWTALQYAVREGKEDAIRFLIDAAASLRERNEEGRNVLDIAARKRMKDVCKLLLEKTPKLVNEKGEGGVTVLHWACAEEGDETIADVLTEMGDLDLNQTDFAGNTALHYAAKTSKTKIVKNLVKKGASMFVVNSEGNTAERMAEVEGHVEVAEYLRKKSIGREDDIDSEGGLIIDDGED